jgi:hypothetical protein
MNGFSQSRAVTALAAPAPSLRLDYLKVTVWSLGALLPWAGIIALWKIIPTTLG